MKFLTLIAVIAALVAGAALFAAKESAAVSMANAAGTSTLHLR